MSDGFSSFPVNATSSAGTRGRPTCEPCRQRKVRCNRKLPCSHCSRLQLSCFYAKRSRRAPIKAPSRASSSPSFETTPPAPGHEPSNGATDEPNSKEILNRLDKVETLLSSLVTALGSGMPERVQSEERERAARPVLMQPGASSGEVLVGGGERGNYVDDSVFVGLLLDSRAKRINSSTKASNSAPPVPWSAPHPSQRLGIVATDVFGPEIDNLSLPPQTYAKLWALYTNNVDPLMKILHVPTIQAVILSAAIDHHSTDHTTLALLYSVSFAAVASIQPNEAADLLGFERLTLLRYLMQQMDIALMKARLLIYPNLQALQALVIYLTALRTHDTGRSVWVLVGIAIRIAESLGVHQDGSRLGLSPFETEMRCRLWWHLTALDTSAPEDHGFNSTIVDRGHHFRLPLNVEDSELFPQMTELPTNRQNWTDMTFSIANLDICRSLRRAVATTISESTEEKERAIQEAEHAIWQRYIRIADHGKPICRAADALLRISVTKTRFVLALRSWFSQTSGASFMAIRRYHQLPHFIFAIAIELLENGYLLQSGKLVREFAWFYQQHPQLHALFLVLHALHDFPERPEADRAWAAVDNYFTCLEDFEEACERKGRTSCVWTVLHPLRERALESRRRPVRDSSDSAPADSQRIQGTPTTTVDNKATGTADDTFPEAANGTSEACESLQANILALEPLTFDNILAWQDFSDWFNMDQMAA